MLLHLPPMPGHGDGPREKNGPALAGHGAEAVRGAIAREIAILPEQLRRSLTWDQEAEMARHARLQIDAGLARTRTPTGCCDSNPEGNAPRGTWPGRPGGSGRRAQRQTAQDAWLENARRSS